MKNKILFLIMLIRAMVLYLRIRYNIFLRHNIAFTYCLHIKGQLFFIFWGFLWSFYFYCLVLVVNPMIISTKCTDLLLCTFKTGHLLLIIMVTDCINQLRKNDDSRTIFNS